MTRLDTASARVSLGSRLSLGRSAVGGSSIMSTSPASSAATREAALVSGRKITFAQAGFGPQ